MATVNCGSGASPMPLKTRASMPFIALFLFVLFTQDVVLSAQPPNIVLIVIDDLGWNDAPWNNPDSLAVHLGKYAREGVVLDRHYVHPKCSPSRASLLTGRYAWTMGRQRGAIERFQPTGLSTSIPLLPQLLKTAGYKTHAIGKWHLGFCDEGYLPTRRGFDSFFGMLQQSTHYRSRMITCSSFKFRKEMVGYDLRRNESVSFEYYKRFAPNMYSKEARKVIRSHNTSEPLFLYLPLMSLHTPHVGMPPKRFRGLYDSSSNSGFESSSDLRDILIAAVDFSIHKVFVDLKHRGLMDNTVVVVTTDNGGGPWDSNTPLRGTKETLYEGGIRGAAFVHSPLLGRRGTYRGLMHLADWVPTLLGLAGVEPPTGLDGVDQWASIREEEEKSPHQFVIHNIDRDPQHNTWQAAITYDQWKLIWGQEYLLKKTQPHQRDRVQLYDVFEDPSERINVASEHPEVVEMLKAEVLAALNTTFTEADWPKGTKKGWPSNFDGYISPGWCQAK